ncbi:MAG TPA: nitroreductase family protein [Burkholderiales bacterium]|nr:nitroreductase family protein [Burkholderiales bacterium]
MKKPAKTEYKIHEIIAERWSPRALDSSKPVSREHLHSLIEAARWAPSCFGDEPWRYIIWDRFADEPSWHKAFECLVPGNQSWCKNAPILMISLADTLFEYNDSPNRFGQYDTGAASENLVLQAEALGLAAHQMGGYDPEKARKTFSIPERFVCMSMIAVGHPASPEILDEDLRTKELAERVRKPASSRFFEGAWGNPVKS